MSKPSSGVRIAVVMAPALGVFNFHVFDVPKTGLKSLAAEVAASFFNFDVSIYSIF